MRHLVEGFILSIIFTLGAYFLVTMHFLQGWILVFGILGLAIIQAWIQLVFFLHLGQKEGSRSNLLIFLSTVSIIFIIVAGSLWIMSNLNYHMTPSDVDTYILHNEGIKK